MQVNNAFSDITGYSEDEILLTHPQFLFSQNSEEIMQNIRENIEKDDFFKGEIYGRGKNGEIIPVILTINAIRDDKGEASNF
ncbi:MAG: PAS domain-containing protein, partial [Paludibacteraceae bacterium]|nr:PAS domain-containing protein [Paludibacteraceae bacterium]